MHDDHGGWPSGRTVQHIAQFGALIMASAAASSFFPEVKTSKSQINMAFEKSNRHPKWPKVVDAAIEAQFSAQNTWSPLMGMR